MPRLRESWERLKGLGLVALMMPVVVVLFAASFIAAILGIDKPPRDDFGQLVGPGDKPDAEEQEPQPEGHRVIPTPHIRHKLTT